MAPRYRGLQAQAFSFPGAATTLGHVVTSPRRSSLGLAGLGVLVGAVVGWVTGLLKAPRTGAQQ
jgi:hypothetical protein